MFAVKQKNVDTREKLIGAVENIAFPPRANETLLSDNDAT